MRVKIQFKEIEEHLHEITVVGNEADIDAAINDVERSSMVSCIDDVADFFEKYKCEIEEINEDYFVDGGGIEYYDEVALEEECDDEDEDE